jgi:hypothetical protein
LEAACLPSPPVPHVAHVTNCDAGQAKIKIYQIGATFTQNIATLDHQEPTTAALFRNCIDF